MSAFIVYKEASFPEAYGMKLEKIKVQSRKGLMFKSSRDWDASKTLAELGNLFLTRAI